MIGYDKAKEIADSYNDRMNWVEEYNDAYVFFVHGSRSLGGEDEPLAVLKRNGKVLPFWAYLDEGKHNKISEYEKE